MNPIQSERPPGRAGPGESDAVRLRRTTAPDAVGVELVSALAGDRRLTPAETDFVLARWEARGDAFYADLLYSLTHQYFGPELARNVWLAILAHKRTMSERLDRNVRVTVAALDYLSNITSELRSPTLISEAHVAEIANLSMRDRMTGLYNHSTCFELLDLELKGGRRARTGVSVILLDVDDFKSLNDRFGHQEGDRVLIELAGTLQGSFRDSDIIGRLGGDEFVAILTGDTSHREACDAVERAFASAAGITCGGRPISISAGVVRCEDSTISAQELLGRADRALYAAKAAGKNQWVLV